LFARGLGGEYCGITGGGGGIRINGGVWSNGNVELLGNGAFIFGLSPFTFSDYYGQIRAVVGSGSTLTLQTSSGTIMDGGYGGGTNGFTLQATGTTFGKIVENSGGMDIQSGAAPTTALTLDGSQNATFHGNVSPTADNSKDLGSASYQWRDVYAKGHLYLADGCDIDTGTTAGTMIAQTVLQKLGFFGATPITQRAKASYNNWASLSDVVDALVDLGLFDQP
jgi:hypothetical protein